MSRLLHFYCGHHTRVSLVSDGDQGECGWETTIRDVDAGFDDGAVYIVCGRCGAELGPDDCSVVPPQMQITSRRVATIPPRRRR